MSQLMLEGQVDHASAFAAALKKFQDRIDELESELSIARSDVEAAKREASRATAKLRKLLTPWRTAILEIYGEVQGFDGDDADTPIPRASKVWESWKTRLGHRAPDLIDLLLLHGEMTRDQIRIGLQAGWSTVDEAISQLTGAQLLLKPSKGRYRLKEL